MSLKTLDEITDAVHNEVAKADEIYGPFTSTHEGFGVLAEEMSELLDAIRKNDHDAIRAEAVQVSAVAARIAVSLSDARTRSRSGMSD